jgi:tetratricopeptide (TPR) repeat protein
MGCGFSKRTVADSIEGTDLDAIALRLNGEAKVKEEAALLDEARDLYERALEVMRASKGERSAGYAVILSNVACLSRTETKYDEALQLLAEALDVIVSASNVSEETREEMRKTIIENSRQTEAWKEAERLELLELCS